MNSLTIAITIAIILLIVVLGAVIKSQLKVRRLSQEAAQRRAEREARRYTNTALRRELKPAQPLPPTRTDRHRSIEVNDQLSDEQQDVLRKLFSNIEDEPESEFNSKLNIDYWATTEPSKLS